MSLFSWAYTKERMDNYASIHELSTMLDSLAIATERKLLSIVVDILTIEDIFIQNHSKPEHWSSISTRGESLLSVSSYASPTSQPKLVQAAISKFEEALVIDPTDHRTLWLLGTALKQLAVLTYNQDDAQLYWQKATHCFQKVVDQDPESKIYAKSLKEMTREPELHWETYKEAHRQAAIRSESIYACEPKLFQKRKKAGISRYLNCNNMTWFILGACVGMISMFKSRSPR